jgi:hypothetical protein
MPGFTGAGFTVHMERFFEFREQVGLWSEVAEVFVARFLGFRHCSLHLLACEAVKGVTLDETGAYIFAKEYLFKRTFDG